jgi:hypothetical protein
MVQGAYTTLKGGGGEGDTLISPKKTSV